MADEMLRFGCGVERVRQGVKVVGGRQEAGGERCKTPLKVFRKEKKAL